MTAGTVPVLIGRDRWLRRQRRDAESVGVLGSALAAFDRIGAPVWADRARAEMTAALAGQPPAAII